MKTVTLWQRSGRVGKSTAAANLAAAFVHFHGMRVLLLDTDDRAGTGWGVPGNTLSMLPTKRPIIKTVDSLLLEDEAWVEDVAEATEWEGIDLVACRPGLSREASCLEGVYDGHLVLRRKVQAANGYDLCIIDTSTECDMVSVNALCASDGIVIPYMSEPNAITGIAQTLDTYRKVRDTYYRELNLYGLACVNEYGVMRGARELQGNVDEAYPGLRLPASINHSVTVEEAEQKRESIFGYAPYDSGAVQYRALAEELSGRIGL